MKITVVKLGGIGDLVQLAIALYEYRKQHQDVTIDWVTSKSFASLVNAFSVADRVIAIDDQKLFLGNYFERCWNLFLTIFYIARLTYSSNQIITAYADWRYELLTIATFWIPRIRFSNKKSDFKLIQGRNRVFEYFSLLKQQPAFDLDVAKASQDFGASFISNSNEAVQALQLESGTYIVLIPGGAKNLLRDDGLRRWPVAHYRQLAGALIELGENVIIAGSPEDEWVKKAFLDLPVIDMIGKTSLLDLIQLLNHSKLIVAHDTGPLHLAVLTNTPLIALFGPTLANAILPLGRSNSIGIQLGNVIACSPCYDGKNYANCENARCMKEITPTRVLDQAKLLLSF